MYGMPPSLVASQLVIGGVWQYASIWKLTNRILVPSHDRLRSSVGRSLIKN